MNGNLNWVEKTFYKRIKSSKLLRSKFGSNVFSLLNNGDTFWHLIAKTQDKELLEIVKNLNPKDRPDINAYNKDGILPIHSFLSSIVHFKNNPGGNDDGHPYFSYKEDFIDEFLAQGVELNKFWLKPIYSAWRAHKEHSKDKKTVDNQFKFRFNFPSINIFGYPSEMLYLLYKDIFLFHELPEDVFTHNYNQYERLFHKLYVFDERDISSKQDAVLKINPDNRHDFTSFKHISFFAVAYIAGERDFYSVLPILNSPILDFTIQSNNDGHTILHNLLGKIKSKYHKMHPSTTEKIIKQVILNPSFSMEHLQILNNFGSSPVAVLNKELFHIIDLFKVLKLKNDIEDHLDTFSETTKETQENYIEEEESIDIWKL